MTSEIFSDRQPFLNVGDIWNSYPKIQINNSKWYKCGVTVFVIGLLSSGVLFPYVGNWALVAAGGGVVLASSCSVIGFVKNHLKPDYKKLLEQHEALARSKRSHFEKALAIFTSAAKCLTQDSDSARLQRVFQTITEFYVPDCPHTSYVTAESLVKIDERYNTNQFFYAGWCHITALAMSEMIPINSLDDILKFGGYSRRLLAYICRSNNWENFGERRGALGLLTPLPNDPTSPYSPWYPLMQEKGNNFIVFAVPPKGKKIEGTTRVIEWSEYYKKNILQWKHGTSPELLHEASEKWLKKANTVEDYSNLYHTLVQYTPLIRGSATFSYTLLMGLFIHKGIPLPKAITLLDCYALSFQADEFAKRVFIPWFKGEPLDPDLLTPKKSIPA